MNKFINCKICSKKLVGKQTFFCSAKCKNKAHQSYQSQQSRGIKRKHDIIRRFGGKCSKCGYCKNLSALTFHHNNPSLKEFKLDIRSLSNRTFSKIEKEMKKCILVCHNCHAEIHNPQHNLEASSSSRLL